MRYLTRREGLGLAVAAATTVIADTASTAARTAPPAGLDTIARRGGRRFGSAVAWSVAGADSGSFANPAYARLLQADCGMLVAENAMKWQALRPDAATFDFARFDAILAYAQAQGMTMRGHNLLWHQPKWLPAWLNAYDFGAAPAREADRLLTTHIDTVCRRYGTRIASYDVVNEAVNPADGTLYDTALSRAMGGAAPTLDRAFHAARAAAPHAELVYNDYMSWEPGNAAHRAGVLRLLQGFRARGVPVDTLGIQSHLMTQGPDIAATIDRQGRDWRSFLDAVVAMGYRLAITELDVRDTGLPADPATRDAGVAAYMRGYLDLMLGYPQLRDILIWGMSDRYSWIERFDPRTDGAKRRPCPYDARFAPKPMRTTIADALAAAAPRITPRITR